MFSHSLISASLSPALSAALRAWPTREAEQQEVHVRCAESTACMVFSEADLLGGATHVARLAAPLTDWSNGIVFVVSDDFCTNRDELQLTLLRMKLKLILVPNVEKAAEMIERMRKTAGTADLARRDQQQPALAYPCQIDALAAIGHMNDRRARALLTEFKSVAEIARASESSPDALAVKGVGSVVSGNVKQFFDS